MSRLTPEYLLAIDRQHVWHPYSSFDNPPPVYLVESAEGCVLTLADGRQLLDGMASWWCVIHGYNNPALNNAAKKQIDRMAHVMFGGLTHASAIELAKLLIDITPAGLNKVFFSDSGSVAVEVAIKMAVQYWHSVGKPGRNRLLALRNGYHGDTFGAMSVCDPVTGMHHLFTESMVQQFFVEAPIAGFATPWDERYISAMRQSIETHRDQLAAVILEPIVQGAGGMRFYPPEYLRRVRQLCDDNDILLIADEIATGFGRTGKLFACEHAAVSADILCLGKALTGGYMSLAATLCNDRVSEGICSGEAGVFMHGPTFMGNPLATAVALASTQLLLSQDWQNNILRIEAALRNGLKDCESNPHVSEVRVLGGIGVVEMRKPVNMAAIQSKFIEAGVWIRPFGRLVYVMPPYTMSDAQLRQLTAAIRSVLSQAELFSD